MNTNALERRTIYDGRLLPAILVAPQLLITIIFFLVPTAGAIVQSVQATDAFGMNTIFVGFSNFISLLESPLYHASILRTILFCIAVTSLVMAGGLVLACHANRKIKGALIYRVLIICPYAIAPALASVLFVFLFQPQVGLLTNLLAKIGIHFNYATNGWQALLLVIIVTAWQQVSYNFIFYLAALQSVPTSILEAAKLDGAHSFYRFRTIIWPMLKPTTVFLLVTNIVYTAFNTFDVIFALTGGGPGTSTNMLVVKIYRDGIINLDLGGSAAQSVLLMAAIIAVTSIQFRIARKRAS